MKSRFGRTNYDRGNDHYAWFLGPRMIYTSGIISDTEREETLEEMQDNKMAVVCEKIDLMHGETMLDIGCGWGTLAKFASLNYSASVTGLTIAENLDLQCRSHQGQVRAQMVPGELFLCLPFVS